MKIVYVGESWVGSCARSMCEALSRSGSVEVIYIKEDLFFSKSRNILIRICIRIFYKIIESHFNYMVIKKIKRSMPDFFVVYKGWHVSPQLVRKIKKMGIKTVNIYPDYSPHVHGSRHKVSVGLYDLVISTKIYHPANWNETYGYKNKCQFVPQGFDPILHLCSGYGNNKIHDVVVIATYRSEYSDLLIRLAKLAEDSAIGFVVGGHGWDIVKNDFPRNWNFVGGVHGLEYIDLLKKSKICIAPLNRIAVVSGVSQPGDVDTTRTYELAAANCFFIHQDTDYVRGLYESEGIPFFKDENDLWMHIKYFIDRQDERLKVANAAHDKAVRFYSLDSRAREIINILLNEK